MSALRVLIVQPWLDWRGAETQSIQLVEDLQRLGIESKLVCLFVRQAANVESIRSSLLLPHPFLQRLLRKRVVFSVFSLPVLCYLLLRYGRDFSVFNPHNFPSVWAAGLVAHILRKRVVWTAHNFPQHPFRGIWQVTFELCIKKIDAIIVRRCSAIIAVSRKVARQVKDFYQCGAHVIYPALNESYYLNLELRRAVYKGMENIPENATVLLHCGRVCAEKMQQFTLDVFSRLTLTNPQLYLVFAGSGDVSNLCIDRCSDRVVFLGFVEKHELVSVYARSQILIHPSSYGEGCTMVPFEAIASGTQKVMLADGAGADELLNNLTECVIFKPTDGVESAAELLRTLITRPIDHHEMVLPSNVKREFMTARYKEVFESVL